MKKNLVRLLVFSLIMIFSFAVNAKEKKTEEDKKGTSIKSIRQKRREDRKKWKEERRRKRAEERMIRDHHKKIQTKAVNKRMRKSRRKAQRVNENKREFFLKRWFSR